MSDVPVFPTSRFRAVAIASSTGGPGLVERILAALPADLAVPLFVAQHLPPAFTPGFAAQIDRAGALSAVHAEDGMPVYPGTVYVGPGRQHLRVRQPRSGAAVIEVGPEPAELAFKPSADELFRSCAEVYGRSILAVVLTGIGHDGTLGAMAIRAAGGMVLTQAAETCAVYGMPKSCVINGLSDAQLTPEQIARALLQLSPRHGRRAVA